MTSQYKPFISADQNLSEITFTVVVLAILLTVILAASNAYLALKMGLLTSASIPAAILSMGILRNFKSSNILQNNLVQTAASAGEAVAGGIVYTIPALIIIHYWQHFNYLENFIIALLGGLLGVMFSIPIRRVMMHEQYLKFPEGKAIAEVLIVGEQGGVGLRNILLGGAIGAVLEFAQTGLKVIANYFQLWFISGREVFGFGVGFSATMIGVGYLIGFRVALSIFLGALIAWVFSVPILSASLGVVTSHSNASQLVNQLWDQNIRYIGIGGMIVAGVWTLITLMSPFYESLRISFKALKRENILADYALERTERDIDIHYVLMGILILLFVLYICFYYLFPYQQQSFLEQHHNALLLFSVMYVFVIGFVFSAICGYFSGLVGVSASPGSSVIIAGLLIAALILRTVLSLQGIALGQGEMLNAEAITIIIGAVITGAACIANDNIQDLKVGHIVGATPWKQQVMLMLGVVVAAMVIPPIMQLLFDVYGIAGVMPHPGMDPTQSLAAPPAAMMAALTQAVFTHELPWSMVLLGAAIITLCIIMNGLLKKKGLSVSVLGIATGIYLPLSTTTPLFIGGLIALAISKRLQKHQQNGVEASRIEPAKQRCIMLACGLVVGASLMDVVLSIPFAILKSPSALSIMPAHLNFLAEILGFLVVAAIAWSFYRLVMTKKMLG